MVTRTGQFPIGFRHMNFGWQRDLPGLLAWAKGVGFGAVDLQGASAADVEMVRGAELGVGSVDLMEMGKLLDNDAGFRRELLRRNVEHIRGLGGVGVRNFFTVLIPGDFSRKRSENYGLAVEVVGPLAEAARGVGARVVVEGWPGPAPHFAAIGCTPESCRALIKDAGEGVGINYDPSHLIRLGVDPVRFLREFLPHVFHVHGKDTVLFPEAVYELGLYQDSIGKAPHRYGAHAWRYTIPGRGVAPWGEIFSVLEEGGYGGVVSVELEDEEFNGTEEGERAGLVAALGFLKGV